MKHLFRSVMLAALASLAQPAFAEFHTFQIEELYSNGDGTVQYIVMHEAAGMDGESFWSMRTISTTGTHSGVTQTFSFPSDLPGGNCDIYGYGCTGAATKDKRVLIGTAGLDALKLLRVDYVVPNGFLPIDGGTVNYALVDQLTYTALPVDGVTALTRAGTTAANLATNFQGDSAVVHAAGAVAVNYQGLWFNPAESGWGINFAHQGDLIFASWFTYDLSGKGTWLVMTAAKTAPSVYTGSLIQGTGPAFDAVPFPPLGSPGGATVGGLSGTATITFTDANNASFNYTLAGITQTKAITRQLFGAQPVCTFGTSINYATATNYTDLWWATPAGSEAGWGINLTHQSDLIFASWFTFDHDHTPMWLVTTAAKTAANTYAAPQVFRLTGPAFNAVPFPPLGAAGGPTGGSVGTATFTFTDGNNASFNYTVNGVTQTKSITRQSFGAPGTICN